MENGARIGSYEFTSLVRGDLVVRAIFSCLFLVQCIPISTSVQQVRTKRHRVAYTSLTSSILVIVFGNCLTIAFDVVYGLLDSASAPPWLLRVVLFALSNIALRIGFSLLYVSVLQLVQDRHQGIVVDVVEPAPAPSTETDVIETVEEPQQQVRHEPIRIPAQWLFALLNNLFTPALVILAAVSAGAFIRGYGDSARRLDGGEFHTLELLQRDLRGTASLSIAFYSVWGGAAVHLVLYAALLRRSIRLANLDDKAANTLASAAAPLYFVITLTSCIIFALLSPAGLSGSAGRIITSSFTYSRTQAAFAGVIVTGIFTALLINTIIGMLPGRSTSSRFERWKMQWAAKYARGGDTEQKPTHDTLIYNA